MGEELSWNSLQRRASHENYSHRHLKPLCAVIVASWLPGVLQAHFIEKRLLSLHTAHSKYSSHMNIGKGVYVYICSFNIHISHMKVHIYINIYICSHGYIESKSNSSQRIVDRNKCKLICTSMCARTINNRDTNNNNNKETEIDKQWTRFLSLLKHRAIWSTLKRSHYNLGHTNCRNIHNIRMYVHICMYVCSSICGASRVRQHRYVCLISLTLRTWLCPPTSLQWMAGKSFLHSPCMNAYTASRRVDACAY